MRGFQSNNEEVKTAASLALGGVAVGNLEKYLPIVLKEIETQPKRQYLLLHALKVSEIFLDACMGNMHLESVPEPWLFSNARKNYCS